MCILQLSSALYVSHITDVDECQTINYTCPEAADCVNSNGSYKCVCWPGYHKVGNNCTGTLLDNMS